MGTIEGGEKGGRSLLPCSLPVALGIFLSLFLLCMLFPYSGDDWAWGSSLGLSRLYDLFEGYNGRYVGNLLVLALTRSRIIRSLVMAATMFCIPWCINVIVDQKSNSTFWLALVLLLSMPSKVRSQGIAWTSGFTNYAVPALLILLYFVCFRRAFESEYQPNKNLAIPLLLLGVANSLIMENVSLYNIVISLVMLIVTRAKHGIWDRNQMAFLCGSVFGCAIMFSNSAYRSVVEGNDSYRRLNGDGFLYSSSVKFSVTINYYLNLANIALNTVFAACAVFALSERRGIGRAAACIPAVLSAALSYLSFTSLYTFNENDDVPVKAFMYALVTVMLLAALLYLSIEKERPLLGPAVVLSIVCLTAPLLVVNPIGPRNFLITYALFILVACLLVKQYIPEQGTTVQLLVKCAACTLWVAWLVFYGNIATVDYRRSAIVAEAIEDGATVVVIPSLPCSEDVHYGNPEKEPWITRFKMFYGLDEGVELSCR